MLIFISLLEKKTEIGAFATSLVFIVADCQDDHVATHQENTENAKLEIENLAARPRIFLFHHEDLISLPGNIQYVDEFLDYYAHKLEVDFEQVCAV